MCRAWSTFFTSLPLPLYFPLFISVTGACLLWGMETHDWVVRFCQPLVLPLEKVPLETVPFAIGFASHWSWLSVVEAPGHLRHPTST